MPQNIKVSKGPKIINYSKFPKKKKVQREFKYFKDTIVSSDEKVLKEAKIPQLQ